MTDQSRGHKALRIMIGAMMTGHLLGHADDAVIVRRALVAMMGDNVQQLELGFAVAAAGAGDTSLAKEMLGNGLHDHPRPDYAQVVLAAALQIAGASEWKSVVNNILSVSTDTDIREAAQRMLNKEGSTA